jgi:hypothetical protein
VTHANHDGEVTSMSTNGDARGTRASTRTRGRRASATIVSAAFLVAIAGGAAAQAPGPDINPQEQAQHELVELFNKVETRLREMDRLLSDAGAGDTRALKNVGPSGIDELLKRSKKTGEENLQDIDRILEIARQMQQQSSSGQGQGQGQPQSGQGDGKSPLDGQNQTTTGREQTPSAPDRKGQDEKDKQPGGKKPQGEKGQASSPKPGEKPDGEKNPQDPKASKQSAKNQESGPPPGSKQDKASVGSDGKDRWGDLPEQAREVFRSEGGHDMPVQYRDWIDAYYRRLNHKQP